MEKRVYDRLKEMKDQVLGIAFGEMVNWRTKPATCPLGKLDSMCVPWSAREVWRTHSGKQERCVEDPNPQEEAQRGQVSTCSRVSRGSSVENVRR